MHRRMHANVAATGAIDGSHRKIPQMIDEPPNVLMWPADELAPVTLGLLLGIFLEQLAVMTLLGLALAHVYRRFRDGVPTGTRCTCLDRIDVAPISGSSEAP